MNEAGLLSAYGPKQGELCAPSVAKRHRPGYPLENLTFVSLRMCY